jgi:energy-coupling factor transporter ATP-binding protein EcfA2
MIRGNPIWLMLVGSSGCGKSLLLDSIMSLQKIREVGNIKGPSALLSGVSTKDRGKGATGGLLREIGARGALVFKDFTSVLTMPTDPMKELLGAFREIYDGRWTRDVGSDGHIKMTWGPGKLAFIGGCTQAIDRNHTMTAEMGERWVYYRYPESSGYQESRLALNLADAMRAREEIREEVKSFFDELGLGWEQEQARRVLGNVELNQIGAMSAFSARSRSVVVRNNRTREVEDVPQSESPTRLATALGQMYLGLEAIGLGKSERLGLCWQIAMDCMPQVRRKAVDLVIVQDVDGVTLEEFQDVMQVSLSTAKRTLEDLVLHGVLAKRGKMLWELSGWARELMGHRIRG